MSRLQLREYETTRGIRLSRSEFAALRDVAPSVRVAPAVEHGHFDLTPGSYVGVVRLGDRVIEIRPKLPIDRVLFLIAYSMGLADFAGAEVDLGRAATLHEAIAPAFVSHVRRAIRAGVLQGYRIEHDSLPTVRGRIRFADQLRDRYGIVPPIDVVFDEFTEDIVPNRLLRAAIRQLLRMRLTPTSGLHLQALDAAFANVQAVRYEPHRVPRVTWNRLNERYRPSVELARLILEGSVIELGGAGVAATSFLVDVNAVFEDFVVVALREALALSEGTFRQADRTLQLDTDSKIALVPDLSWWEGGRCVLIGDVKYKRVNARGVLHPDLYQLLAYTVAAELPAGVLIYAAGEGDPAAHDVATAGKTLLVETVDLAGEPNEILGQVASLATKLRDLKSAGTRGASLGLHTGPMAPVRTSGS